MTLDTLSYVSKCKKLREILSKLQTLILFVTAFLIPVYASAIEIGAVGDISISRRIIETRNSDLAKIRLPGDIVFANFEGVFSEAHTRDDTLGLKLTMPLGAANVLKQIGVNALSLANNHALDLGSQVYSRTISALSGNGFTVAGLNDLGQVITLEDKKVRLIAFSFSGTNNVNDLEKVSSLIRSFTEDIIIVSAHMGGEGRTAYLIPNGSETYDSEQRGDVIKFAHTCIDAGADIVLGHGPHVLRGIEAYKNKLIVYSLGNFIFDFPGVEKQSNAPACALLIHMKPNGDFCKAKIASYISQQGVPVPDPHERAYKMIKVLSKSNVHSKHLFFGDDATVCLEGDDK